VANFGNADPEYGERVARAVKDLRAGPTPEAGPGF
jgi:hypothetical protein